MDEFLNAMVEFLFKGNRASLTMILTPTLVIPELLFIIIFDYNSFVSLDLVKLLILSLSISIPLFTALLFILIVDAYIKEKYANKPMKNIDYYIKSTALFNWILTFLAYIYYLLGIFKRQTVELIPIFFLGVTLFTFAIFWLAKYISILNKKTKEKN